jgi:hypothetical protein
MNWKDRKDDWKKNAAVPLYMQEKGLERQMAFVLIKVGNRSENGNGCARKSRKGIGKGKMAAPRCSRRKEDKNGKVTVFL